MATPYTTSKARSEFKEVLDSAQRGATPTIERGEYEFAVTDKAGLVQFLKLSVSAKPKLVTEDGAYVLVIPGLPFASEANSLDESVDLLVEDLIDYAAEWHDLYQDAPNHADNWGLVTLVNLLSESQLKEWLLTA